MIATKVKYKTTGIDWMPEVPEDWTVVKLKYIGEAIIGLTYSPTEIVYEGQGMLVLRSSNIQEGEFSTSDSVFIKKKIPIKLITKKGDILLCARNGSVALVGKNLMIDEVTEGKTFGAFMSVYRSEYNNYLKHFFNSQIFKAQSSSFATTTVNQLTHHILMNMQIAFPSNENERNVIIKFLDDQSAKITRFIQTKQRFIELLKEQRQSIITNAVTKGINDGAKMKESVLGEIPHHWEVRRLKFMAEVNFSTVDKHSHKEEKQVRLCNYVDVYKHEYITNDFDFMIATATDAEIKRFTVKKGDVIITKDSETAADIAIPALVVEDLENVVCAYHLAHIKPNRELVESEFLFRLFQSKKINSHFEVAAKGVTRHGLSYDDINSVFLPYPPTLNEQQEIIKHIKTESRTLDIAISKAEREIELIKEYREAMISEAVTGKMKLQ